MSDWYPFNPNISQQMQTDSPGIENRRGFVALHTIAAASAVVANTSGVLAATSVASAIDVTTGLTQPAVPRNITATAAATTAAHIDAVQVVITGTDYSGAVITETLTAFTNDTAGTVTGAKAFRTVTRVQCPAMGGASATVAIGFGNKFGLPDALPTNTVLLAALNGAREGTAPTVTVSPTVLSDNGFTLNSTPNGNRIDVWYIV